MDPRFASRLIAARGDLADKALIGKVAADRFVVPEVMTVTAPVLDLFSKPDATSLASQLLMGADFKVLETNSPT